MTHSGSHPSSHPRQLRLQLTPIGFGAWAIGGGDWASPGAPGRQRLHRRHHRALDSASTGSTPPPSTASATLKKSSPAPSSRHPTSPTSSPSAACAGRGATIYRCLKAESLTVELENSLRRLNVEAIDLYQIHWPDPEPRNRRGLGDPGPVPASRARCGGSAFPTSMSSR